MSIFANEVCPLCLGQYYRNAEMFTFSSLILSVEFSYFYFSLHLRLDSAHLYVSNFLSFLRLKTGV